MATSTWKRPPRSRNAPIPLTPAPQFLLIWTAVNATKRIVAARRKALRLARQLCVDLSREGEIVRATHHATRNRPFRHLWRQFLDRALISAAIWKTGCRSIKISGGIHYDSGKWKFGMLPDECVEDGEDAAGINFVHGPAARPAASIGIAVQVTAYVGGPVKSAGVRVE